LHVTVGFQYKLLPALVGCRSPWIDAAATDLLKVQASSNYFWVMKYVHKRFKRMQTKYVQTDSQQRRPLMGRKKIPRCVDVKNAIYNSSALRGFLYLKRKPRNTVNVSDLGNFLRALLGLRTDRPDQFQCLSCSLSKYYFKFSLRNMPRTPELMLPPSAIAYFLQLRSMSSIPNQQVLDSS